MAEQETKQTMNLNELEKGVPEGIRPAVDTIIKYKKQIVLGLAVLLALAVLWSGVRWYNANALKTAQTQLGEVLQNFSGEERISKLAELSENVPSSAMPAVLFELATICLEEKQYDKAVQYYGQLADNSDGDARTVARLGETKAMMLSGKASEATKILQEMTTTASASLAIPVNRQLAVAAEQAGDIPAAITALEKLQETGSSDKQFVEFKLNQLKNK